MGNTIGKEVRRWAASRGKGAPSRRNPGSTATWRLRNVAAGLAACLVLLCAPTTWAQNSTITLTESKVSRTQYREDPSLRWWISYEDCIRGDAFTFPLGVSTNSDLIEVWAGNDDCAERRGQQDRGQCWIVAAAPPDTPQTTVIVPVRNVVAQSTTISVPTEYDSSVCEGSIDPDGQSVTFYFFFQDGGKALAGGITWDAEAAGGTGFDLVGPAPPGSVDVTVGESQLTIRIGGVDEEGDRERFEAFCVEGTAAAPTLDAGGVASVGDGGGAALDAGGNAGAAPPECSTPLLRAGQRAPLGYSCGEENETSGTLRTSELSNDVTYAVGVAGQDKLGNAGALSEIKCGTPLVLNDFYEMYSDSGGRGGGGFCNLSFPRQSSEQSRLMALGLFFAALLWRRNRSRE